MNRRGLLSALGLGLAAPVAAKLVSEASAAPAIPAVVEYRPIVGEARQVFSHMVPVYNTGDSFARTFTMGAEAVTQTLIFDGCCWVDINTPAGQVVIAKLASVIH